MPAERKSTIASSLHSLQTFVNAQTSPCVHVVNTLTGADPGFLEMGFICMGFALLILSHYS